MAAVAAIVIVGASCVPSTDVSTCSVAADCPSDQVCRAHVCTVDCVVPEDCPNALGCRLGRCSYCTRKEECGAGLECAAGRCTIPRPVIERFDARPNPVAAGGWVEVNARYSNGEGWVSGFPMEVENGVPARFPMYYSTTLVLTVTSTRVNDWVERREIMLEVLP